MLDTFTGFVLVGVAIVVGWIIGRIDLLGPHGRHVLSRLTFFVLSPFLSGTAIRRGSPRR